MAAATEQLNPLQRALFVLRETQAKLESIERARTEPIAIVGIGCRLPGGVRDAASYWQLLRNKTDAIREIPPDRWDVDAYYDPDPQAPGKMNTRWGGFLENIQEFDNAFFGISEQEATRMDPQQRLLLETAWEALEDAGLVPQQLRGSATGVFVGISLSEYGMMLNSDGQTADPFIPTGAAVSIAANRISFAFDFHGPSVSIDTACSSSLVAVHLACQSLRNGESTMALAGGVNLVLSPNINVNLTRGGFLASDGRCRSFDAKATGYVRSEGVALVVLKPLSAAIANGDRIYALVRGSAVNQDGKSNGLTAPNRQAQEDVLREAYTRSRINPAHVRYIEAHGTGTPLGDPIEVRALASVLSPGRLPQHPCMLGAAKTNIGHTEATAGAAGIIKVALSLHHRELPPTVHFSSPNVNIPFDEMPLKVQQTLGPWPEGEGPLVGGVSSFGFGGTNAHVVFEEAPASTVVVEKSTTKRTWLLPLSARSDEALAETAGRVHDVVTVENLEGVVYTAAVRRDHHDFRMAVLADSAERARAGLKAFQNGESRPGVLSGRKTPGRRSRLVFVFSGQGPQWWAMGRQLLESEPVYRATIERCGDILRELGADWSLLDELRAAETSSRIHLTRIAQPALFAVQIGLAELLKSWGITPDAVVGHSLGEVAAAYVAGGLELKDALRVIFERGRLMQRAAGPGRTAAIDLPVDEVRRVLDKRVGIAAINSPGATTISGDADAVEAMVEAFKQRGVQATMLRVDVAFHSHHMEPIRKDFESALADVRPRPLTMPMISTVTGQPITSTDLVAGYWGRNLREPVNFAAAMTPLMQKHHDVFLEISPHPVLAGSIAQCLRQQNHEAAVLHTLRREDDEQTLMMRAVAELYVRGYSVNWPAIYPSGRFVPLPSYPWQRGRFWLEQRKAPSGSLLQRHVHLANAASTDVWEVDLDAERLPFADCYEMDGSIMVSGTALLELASAAAKELIGHEPAGSSDIDFPGALFVPKPGTGVLQIILIRRGSDEAKFEIYGRVGEATQWTLHATGTMRL